jgi:hypothetical protein
LPALRPIDVLAVIHATGTTMVSNDSHLCDDNLPVVVAFARTPFGRFEGKLASLTAPKLGALAVDEVLRRGGPDLPPISSVYAGIGMLGGSTLTATGKRF